MAEAVPVYSESEPVGSRPPLNLGGASPGGRLGGAIAGGAAARLPLQARRASQRPPMQLQLNSAELRPAAVASESAAAFRGWWRAAAVAELPADVQQLPTSLRVVSYNILAPHYATTDRYSAPTECLAVAYRMRGVAREVAGAQPDVVVLSEVTEDMLALPELQAALEAYAWYHVPATGSGTQSVTGSVARLSVAVASSCTTPQVRCSQPGSAVASPLAAGGALAAGALALAAGVRTSQEAGGEGLDAVDDATPAGREGVCIAWRHSRFAVAQHRAVRFNALARDDRKLSDADRRAVARGSHNVAAVVTLHDRVGRCPVVVAGIHALYSAAWSGHAQRWQAGRLAEAVAAAVDSAPGDVAAAAAAAADGVEVPPASRPAGVVVAGDFNAAVGDPSMQLLLGGSASPEADATSSGPGGADPAGRAAAQRLGLRGAYDDYFGAAAHDGFVTRGNESEKGRIDHILFGGDALMCAEVGRLGPPCSMPSDRAPSDHYMIAARLQPVADM